MLLLSCYGQGCGLAFFGIIGYALVLMAGGLVLHGLGYHTLRQKQAALGNIGCFLLLAVFAGSALYPVELAHPLTFPSYLPTIASKASF
jgi:hypothetical protein